MAVAPGDQTPGTVQFTVGPTRPSEYGLETLNDGQLSRLTSWTCTVEGFWLAAVPLEVMVTLAEFTVEPGGIGSDQRMKGTRCPTYG